MATRSGGRPTPEEAASALAESEQVRPAMYPASTPAWLMPTLAGLVSLSLAAQAFPAPANVVAAGAAALIIGALLGLDIERAEAWYRASRSNRLSLQVIPVMAIATLGALAAVFNVWWAWLIAAVAGGLLFLVLGSHLERQTRSE